MIEALDVKEKTRVASMDICPDLLSKVVKYTDNAVIITDLKGRIQFVNEGFEKITEYSKSEVMGKKPGDLLQGPETDPQTVERIRENLQQFNRVKETILNYSKSGKKYWLQLDIYPHFDDQGIPSHFLAIESDISEVKEKENIATEYNNRITENISYAERLQSALFRNNSEVNRMFEENFIFDQPKDTVGGDFYIFDTIQNKRVVLLGDCTGHGASGAIMTAASISIIRELLNTYKTLSPSMIITKSQEKLAKMMGEDTMDSFEATLLFIDDKNKEIRFATTSQELYFFGEKSSKIYKKTRSGEAPEDQSFSFVDGDNLYMSSDGFKDQFGGENNKKFGGKRLYEFLLSIQTINLAEQFLSIRSQFEQWRGENPQTDDVLMIGLTF